MLAKFNEHFMFPIGSARRAAHPHQKRLPYSTRASIETPGRTRTQYLPTVIGGGYSNILVGPYDSFMLSVKSSTAAAHLH